MISKGDYKGLPKINGLVLAGGKSMRMGYDKGAINWHGKEQRYFMADLVGLFCDEVYISCRKEQQAEINSGYAILTDSVEGSGPLVAILSAFRKYPDATWLVVACDLPLLDADTLRHLLKNRDKARIATTYESPFDQLPEPLITIWEPAARPILESFLSDGFTCPRKALIKNAERVKMLAPPHPDALMNANTPEDAEKVRTLLSGVGN